MTENEEPIRFQSRCPKSVEEVRKLRGRETENLSKNILDLEEELAYYKSKCASLEEGMFNLERENEQLKTELRNLRRLANELYMEGSE